MPIYEYRSVEGGCEQCSGGFDAFQDMDEQPLEKCPRCGARVEKVLSPFQAATGDALSRRSLKEHGFSKFRRTQDGSYEKEV